MNSAKNWKKIILYFRVPARGPQGNFPVSCRPSLPLSERLQTILTKFIKITLLFGAFFFFMLGRSVNNRLTNIDHKFPRQKKCAPNKSVNFDKLRQDCLKSLV